MSRKIISTIPQRYLCWAMSSIRQISRHEIDDGGDCHHAGE
jgi:hypothetical protein